MRAGEAIVQGDLANTLRRIAEQGAPGFYQGETAQAIATTIADRGGFVTLSDLSQYRAVFRTPLRTEYRGVTVEVMSPPSAGGVAVVEMLAMLEQQQAWQWDRNSVEALHEFAEVAKRAHADRRFGVVDPDSVKDYDAAGNLANWRAGGGWLERFPIAERPTPAAALYAAYKTAHEEAENTTHFSVADQSGLVVSCTTTLSRGYGARFVVPGTGVLLNNSFAAFGTAGLDVPKPGRRMTSSMSPTIVSVSGLPVLVLGSPGGDTIPNTVVQVLRNLVDYRLPLSAAVDAPRVHHGFVPDQILYESTRPPSAALLAGLRKRGHVLSGARRTIGDANVIATWDGMFWGYADPREGGLAAGPLALAAP
jgi:gamma-glutamyltranspeptidase/glutathione hydrolase